MKRMRERKAKSGGVKEKEISGSTPIGSRERKALSGVRNKAKSGGKEKEKSGASTPIGSPEKEKAKSGASTPIGSPEKEKAKSGPSTPIGSPEKEEGFYERILRLGYGPPDGDKLDKGGWRRYFHEMPDFDHHNIIRKVFGHLIPEEWNHERFQIHFLDGIDKNLTKRSHAFVRCPRYKYIYQNGYGPPDGHTLSIKEWRKYMEEMPQDEQEKMVKDLFTIPRDPDNEAKVYQTYMKQFHETEGYDMDVYVPAGGGTIGPMFHDMSLAKADASLNNYCKKALDVYNVQEGSDYTITQVVKACYQCVAGMMYYITFEAMNSKDHLQVFQAKICDDGVKRTVDILQVRRKPEKA